MADDPSTNGDPQTNDPQGSDPQGSDPQASGPNDTGAQGTPGAGAGDGQLLDKHGEPAINKARYDRDIKAKDDRIAELEKQLEDANGKADEGKTALDEVKKLRGELADERVSSALKLAGCVNEKAAKALLDDYDGDVPRLKEACPYLFKTKAGSTGARPAGAASTSEERRKRAQEAIKGKVPARR